MAKSPAAIFRMAMLALGPVFVAVVLLQAGMEANVALKMRLLSSVTVSHNHFGDWIAVAASVLLVSFFALAYLLPQTPGKKDWRSLGLVQAFIVALYAEMYGFPLTIFLLSNALGLPSPLGMGGLDGHLLAVAVSRVFGMNQAGASFGVMAVSSLLMASGFLLIFTGWRRIHRGGGQLVTAGVYRWIRHPQYSGLLVFTLGLLINWPTLPTLLMWPVLLLTYIRLARREEQWAESTFGASFREYKGKVPAFIPRFRPAPVTLGSGET